MEKGFSIKRLIVIIILLILLVIFAMVGVFFYELKPVSKSGEIKDFIVESGSSVNSVFESLEKENLIKSAFFMKIYSKLSGGLTIQSGLFKISPSMDVTEIFDILNKGGDNARGEVNLTFKEGDNVRDFASLVSENFDISKEDVFNKLKDTEYLDSLISKYWFLTDEIKNKDIYYSLEGYLFPNTYAFYKDSSLEEIISKFLDETEEELNKYKADIEKSKYSVHEVLTLASIVELESYDTKDRKDIAGVFLNRLNDGMPLQSCVSTYYAFNINMGDRDLNQSEIDDCSSKYNTRCTSLIGLPVGPIGNPGLTSIEAAINPNKHNYYYFLSDKNLKTYFSETYEEHERKQEELEDAGLWLQY